MSKKQEQEQKYRDIVNAMEVGKEYTASELSVAPATMTAIVRRGLVNKIAGSPARYVRDDGEKSTDTQDQAIIEALKGYPDAEEFELYGELNAIGRLTKIVNGVLRDVRDYMKPFTAKNYNLLVVNGVKIQLN